MLKLDKRLKAIIDNIPNDTTIVDIGCDHGKIAIGAIINNRARFAIATDISAKSLNKAKILANTYGIQDKISFREGDGLGVIDKGEAKTLIIAGMGSREIISILGVSNILFDTYIFVPHQDTPQLREYLSFNLFYISKDYIVECSGKFYSIIIANKVDEKEDLNYKTIMLGKSSRDNKDYIKFIDYEYQRLQRLMKKIPKDDTKHNLLLEYYEAVKRECYE